MVRARHILFAILLPLCACQQAHMGQQGLGDGPVDTVQAAQAQAQAAATRARRRADLLEALFDRKHIKREYDRDTYHWVFPARTPSPACAPAHLAEKSIHVLTTAPTVNVIEFSTYYSGRSIEVWDEDLLEKKVHAQCEALVYEKVLESGAVTCKWYTDGPNRSPAIGFLSPTDILPAKADSLLQAWGIDSELRPH